MEGEEGEAFLRELVGACVKFTSAATRTCQQDEELAVPAIIFAGLTKVSEELQSRLDEQSNQIDDDELVPRPEIEYLQDDSDTESLDSKEIPSRILEEIDYDPSSEILGEGNYGTIVYQGTFGERPVAIKKMLLSSVNSRETAETELNLMRDSDNHPNVVKYYASKFMSDHVLIAMDLCDCSLTEYIEKEERDRVILESVTIPGTAILEQLTKGVVHLHEKLIVHRDIKPDNILLKLVGRNEVLVKITDFGISRRIPKGHTSQKTTFGAGTEGWMAPEILKELKNKIFSFKSDIFSLGCVYYYVLTKGQHPFCDGDGPYSIPLNICKGTTVIKEEDFEDPIYVGSVPLIRSILTCEKNSRPKAQSILKHHLFWNKPKMLKFLHLISDARGKERDDCAKVAEDNFKRSTGGVYDREEGGWRDKICEVVKKEFLDWNPKRNPKDKLLDLKIFYDGRSVMKLIRLIRNIENHLNERPAEVRKVIGTVPDGLLNYFLGKFPSLLDDAWLGFQSMKKSKEYQDYYCMDHNFY